MRVVDLGPLVELRYRVVEQTPAGRDRVVAGFAREGAAEAYRRHREKIDRRIARR